MATEALAIHDKNGDGGITGDEFEELKKRHAGEEVTFADFDVNKDGVITADEIDEDYGRMYRDLQNAKSKANDEL